MKKHESRRTNGRKKVEIDRTTVSMPKKLLDAGMNRAEKIRPFTFSNYVATLIERDIAAAK